jgi:hypothetical protein
MHQGAEDGLGMRGVAGVRQADGNGRRKTAGPPLAVGEPVEQLHLVEHVVPQ